MSHEMPELTDDQRQAMRERTLSDAELIKRGAEYDKSGALEVSEDEQKRLQLENQEIVAETLADYIRRSRKVILTADEFDEDLKKMSQLKGSFTSVDGKVYYFGSDGNLSVIEGLWPALNGGKIAQFRELAGRNDLYREFYREMQKLGFIQNDGLMPEGRIKAALDAKQKQAARLQQKKTEEGFDF